MAVSMAFPTFKRVIIAAPRNNKPNQYNARFDFIPTSNDQINLQHLSDAKFLRRQRYRRRRTAAS